jgi:hypothetical protein
MNIMDPTILLQEMPRQSTCMCDPDPHKYEMYDYRYIQNCLKVLSFPGTTIETRTDYLFTVNHIQVGMVNMICGSVNARHEPSRDVYVAAYCHKPSRDDYVLHTVINRLETTTCCILS